MQNTIVFGGGCFWCLEEPFAGIPGIVSVTPGYMGGHTKNPSYEEVCRGNTGHVEVVEVVYGQMTELSDLLDVFWRNIDPTDAGGQFADRGSQYRPVIFVTNEDQAAMAEVSKKQLAASRRFKEEIVVPIEKATNFYPAEAVHCRYFENHSLAYNRYKLGSGRQSFLSRVWQTD